MNHKRLISLNLFMGRALIHADTPDIINIGSGIAIPAGAIALRHIKGFGRGELLVTAPDVRDEFVLDTSRLNSLTSVRVTALDIESRCRQLGAELRNE
jgi:UDP-glucose 4-epimerase